MQGSFLLLADLMYYCICFSVIYICIFVFVLLINKVEAVIGFFAIKHPRKGAIEKTTTTTTTTSTTLVLVQIP